MKRYLKIWLICGAVAMFGIAATTTGFNHTKSFEIAKNIEIFVNLYKQLNTYYVDDVEPGELMRTGVDAMLESMDPYTNFISESEIEGYRFRTTGKYGGIGAKFLNNTKLPVIAEPHKDKPADKAGIKAGDIVLAIDGTSTEGKSADDVDNILKGAPGTPVKLTIQRPGEAGTKDFSLIREEIKEPNVPYSGLVGDGVGYISLTQFSPDAGKNVENAFKSIKKENPSLKGVILDLRGNPGGYLVEAINVSNVFIPKGEEIVVTQAKLAEWDRVNKTLNKPLDEEIPLVVLIDKNSASASEIVSGVFQDLDRAVLVGQSSYGKGLVQNTYDVGYNSKLKLTIAKYYIPSGRCIQAVTYKDGEPVNIPDSLRTAFKTRNGRLVYDGGGVKPDLLLDDHTKINVLESLKGQNMIFDFVTEYRLKNPSITTVKDFKFNAFNNFLTFLDKKGFDYETKTEKELKQLIKEAKGETLLKSIKKELDMTKANIQRAKKNDLMTYKTEIIKAIEKEIALRYYYKEGEIQMGLKNDIEIQESVKLFNDIPRYKKILK